MPGALPPAKPLILQHCLHTPGPFTFLLPSQAPLAPQGDSSRHPLTPFPAQHLLLPTTQEALPAPKGCNTFHSLQNIPAHPRSWEHKLPPHTWDWQDGGEQPCSPPQHPKPHRSRAQPLHLGSLPTQEPLAKSTLGSGNRLLCFGSWILQTRALITACFYVPRAKIVLLSTVRDQYPRHRTFQWLLVWVIIPGLPLFPS